MTNTHAESAWGMTTTTPSDQIKLLNNIFFSSNKLTESEQNYIQSLMKNVESDQQWGISAGSSNYALKTAGLIKMIQTNGLLIVLATLVAKTKTTIRSQFTLTTIHP